MTEVFTIKEILLGIASVVGAVVSGLLVWGIPKLYKLGFELILEVKLMRTEMRDLRRLKWQYGKLKDDVDAQHGKLRSQDEKIADLKLKLESKWGGFMKQIWILFFMLLFLLLSSTAYAQESANESLPEQVITNTQTLQADPEISPEVKSMLKTLYDLPVIGPALNKTVQITVVIAAILTNLVLFLMVSVRALLTVLNYAGFVRFAELLQKFNGGKFMYWLKYFSMLGAVQPAKPSAPPTEEQKTW
jgi:hypothetical protein